MRETYHMELSEDSRGVRHTSGNYGYMLNFYVDSVGHYKAYQGYYTDREGMETFLLFYTIAGSGCLAYEGEEYHLTKGTAAVIECSRHQFYRTDSDQWEFYFIHFGGEGAEKYYHILREHGAAFVKISHPAVFLDHLREVERWAGEQGPVADVRVSNGMENLFAELMVDWLLPGKEEACMQHQEAILGLMQYLKEHYREEITVDEMAKKVMMSKYYFIRVFKRIVGSSPCEYLKWCRIHESKRLLMETSYSIGQIADLVGYRNVNTYIQNFRHCVGVTPMKYRKTAF